MSDTQLIDAIKADDLAVVRRLTEAGVDVNQQDEQGWTPLNWAAGKGDVEAVRLLLEKGADVFKVGRDQRTPYMIALAAGRAEVARLVREAEERAGGGRTSRQERQYCKAYVLEELRRFPGWPETKADAYSANGNGNGNGYHANGNGHSANGHGNGNGNGNGAGAAAELSDEDVVFIHQDFTVTESMWHGENVIFDRVTPEWKEFCTQVLGFKVPDDLDLIVQVGEQ